MARSSRAIFPSSWPKESHRIASSAANSHLILCCPTFPLVNGLGCLECFVWIPMRHFKHHHCIRMGWCTVLISPLLHACLLLELLLETTALISVLRLAQRLPLSPLSVLSGVSQLVTSHFLGCVPCGPSFVPSCIFTSVSPHQCRLVGTGQMSQRPHVPL